MLGDVLLMATGLTLLPSVLMLLARRICFDMSALSICPTNKPCFMYLFTPLLVVVLPLPELEPACRSVNAVRGAELPKEDNFDGVPCRDFVDGEDMLTSRTVALT